MKWSVGAKIGGGIGLTLLALLLIGLVAFVATRKLISANQWVTHTHVVLEKLDSVIGTAKSAESADRGYVITADDGFLKDSQGFAEKQAGQDLDELLDLTADNPHQKPRLEDLRKLLNIRFEELRGLVDARKDDTDESFHAARQLVKDAVKKRTMEQIVQKVDELRQEELVLLGQRNDEVGFVAALANYVIAIGIPLTIGLAAVAGFIITRNISRPLGQITSAAERIAGGDLGVTLATDRRSDEVGVLARTFASMISSLREMAAVAERIAAGDVNKVAITPQSDRDVLGKAFEQMIKSLQSMTAVAGRIAAGDLRTDVAPQSEKDALGTAFATMITNLRRIMADLSEGSNVLGSSSAQIVASTTELAAGSAQTASAVTETTATVEEVRQTSQVSSQKAKYVSESAQRAAAISESGKKITDDAIEGMGRIREQMSAIADSMVRLSEQTQAISQIIATVDDLSQQSNLLAVNASIEAAKAGDQGKGFAVVAHEVRSLAEQSKGATTQVRTILNDIQKATAAAAMATEQGTKAVEAGVLQSEQAGESILKLAGGVTEAAEAATLIAASSQQQMAGMEQVATAMESIKQASTQNVDSARQLESAARNLARVGQRLAEMVGRYKM